MFIYEYAYRSNYDQMARWMQGTDEGKRSGSTESLLSHSSKGMSRGLVPHNSKGSQGNCYQYAKVKRRAVATIRSKVFTNT